MDQYRAPVARLGSRARRRHFDLAQGHLTLGLDFQAGLRQLLEGEGFAPVDVDRVLDEYQELALAATTDRRC